MHAATEASAAPCAHTTEVTSPYVSHYERTYERILLYVEYGALCPLDDADLMYDYLVEAAELDDE